MSIPRFKNTLFNRKFIGIFASIYTRRNLIEYCRRNNLDLSYNYEKEKIDPMNFEFHTTIIFSNTPATCYLKDGVIKIKDIPLYGSAFELFGENKDVLVMKFIKTNQLEKMREQTLKWGLSDTWPEYKPHITLCYNFKGTQEDINKLQLPTFEMTFNKMKISEIK